MDELPLTTLALCEIPLAESVAAGTLVAADPAAGKESGVRWPIYFTRAAWDRHVALTPAAVTMLCDERGRLWDCVWSFSRAARRFYGAMLRFAFAGVVDKPRSQRCVLYAVVVVQDEAPHVLLITAEEAVGPEAGDAINRYARLLGLDENDEVEGD